MKQNTYQKYADDIQRYLASKLPDVDVHVAMEIGEYISNKTSNLIADVIVERDRQWRREWDKHMKPKKEKTNAET